MSKINGNGVVDAAAVALDTLKGSDKGDMLLFIGDSGALSLYTVFERATTRGRNGDTKLILRTVGQDDGVYLDTTHTLPAGVSMIHKVLPGVNARTMKRVLDGVIPALAAPESAPAAQPEPSTVAQEIAAESGVTVESAAEPEAPAVDVAAMLSAAQSGESSPESVSELLSALPA